MLIVSPEFVQRLKSGENAEKNILSQLDDEMQKVLKSKLTDHDKWAQYNQVLQRYLHFTNQARQPIKIPIETSSNSLSTAVILSTLPKTFKKKAEVFLRLLTASNDMSWDHKGTVTIKGEILPKSNIVDLVHDVLRPRKTINPPGRLQFADFIKDLNVAHVLLATPKQKKVPAQSCDTEVETDNCEADLEYKLKTPATQPSPHQKGAVRKTSVRKLIQKRAVRKTPLRQRLSTAKTNGILDWDRLKL